MASSKQIPLQDWIAELMTTEEGRQPLTCLSLIHSRNDKDVEILTKRGLGGTSGQVFTAKQLSSTFHGSAESIAGGLPGMQQFELLAFFGGSDHPETRYTIRKQGVTVGDDPSGLATEAPTNTGIIQQFMRHNEAMATRMNEGFGKIVDAYGNMVDKLQDRLNKQQSEVDDAHFMAREVMYERINSEHDRSVEIATIQRKTAERAKMLQMLPPLVNRLFNREIFPQGTSDTALIDAVADAIDEDGIMQLAGIFGKNPVIWGPIAARLTDRIEARRVEKKKTEQQILAETNPTQANGQGQPS
jgi:hypothetical protein